MNKKLKWTFIALAAVLIFVPVATASMKIPVNENASGAPAPEKSPAIGDGWELERVDFIHYAKPPTTGKTPKAGSCYKLTGYKWKSLPVSYVINPANPQGLTQDFISSTIAASMESCC